MRRSIIDRLPEKLRSEVDSLIVKNNFSDYAALAEYISDKILDNEDTIATSTLARYGKRFKERMDMVQASTLAAKQLAKNYTDDENDLSAGVLTLVQSELFETLMELQAARDAQDQENRIKILTRAAKSISELSRASINNKKYQQEVRARAEAAAAAVEKIAKKGGLSTETVDMIKKQILGVSK